jgi:hypothetical protein
MSINEKRKRKKLFVHIQGRLGNQLFIYFAAKYFEEHHHKKIIFISDHSNKLHKLGINDNSQELVMPEILFKVTVFALSKISKFKFFFRYIYFCKEIGYENLNKQIDEIKFISGYFQTFYYAENSSFAQEQIQQVRYVLQKKFGFDTDIISKNALAIHVRRGDYLLVKNSYFGIISDGYYLSSIRKMLSLYDIKDIYIFSDSPISKNLENQIKKSFPSLELNDTSNLNSDIQTLALLTCFTYHIISNSTYSWWGTYLSVANKKVIAPQEWFKDRPAPNKLIPNSWDRMQNAWE